MCNTGYDAFLASIQSVHTALRCSPSQVVWRLSSNLIFPSLSQRREKGRLMVEEVKRYRAEMNAMIQDLKDKQDRMQILNEEQAKLNKNINRCVLLC
jgi:hypothetical protein